MPYGPRFWADSMLICARPYWGVVRRLIGNPSVGALYRREALAAHGVEVDHVKIWQTVGKLRRRHGLVMTGEPREPGYRVVDWLWEAKRVRSTVSNSVEGGSAR